jgi:hypothetical protein
MLASEAEEPESELKAAAASEPKSLPPAPDELDPEDAELVPPVVPPDPPSPAASPLIESPPLDEGVSTAPSGADDTPWAARLPHATSATASIAPGAANAPIGRLRLTSGSGVPARSSPPTSAEPQQPALRERDAAPPDLVGVVELDRIVVQCPPGVPAAHKPKKYAWGM